MPNQLPEKKRNFDFIDSLRFIAIITIVLEHTYMWPDPKYFDDIFDQSLQLFTMQVFKFGTIIFYILAGSLIGDKIHSTTSLGYLKKRFDGTFKPWVFWIIIIFLIMIYGNLLVIKFKGGWTPILDEPFFGLGRQIYDIIVKTSFWFILNFLGSISILLIFRKYLYSYKLGLFLLLCSLFYSLNIYHEWIYSQHTTAVLGFVFYLWLGVILHKNFDKFNLWIKNTSTTTLACITILSLIVACGESLFLIKTQPVAEPYNTLRVSNIIYSLCSFAFLYKLGSPRWITKLNPRSSTYGIHLIHYIIIVQVLPTIFIPLNITAAGKSSFELVLIQYARFILTYGASYLIVYIINKFNRIKWIIGQ